MEPGTASESAGKIATGISRCIGRMWRYHAKNAAAANGINQECSSGAARTDGTMSAPPRAGVTKKPFARRSSGKENALPEPTRHARRANRVSYNLHSNGGGSLKPPRSGRGGLDRLDAPITEILQRVRAGDPRAVDELMPAVYAELHAIAERYLRKSRPGHTLQPTALVNEAYLNMFRNAAPRFTDRAHFLAYASRAMRTSW